MKSVFKKDGIPKLSLSYLPDKLPHREEHIEELVMLFSPLIEGTEQVPWAVMIVGPSGTGKTAVVRQSLMLIEQKSRDAGVRLRTEYLNCRFAVSDYSLIQMLALRLMPGISPRGYSTSEVFQAIQQYLNNRKEKMLVALDDFDAFLRSVRRRTSVVYDILKSHENGRGNIFLIIAGIDDFSPYFEESWIRNYIWRTKKSFSTYESNELYDILQFRAQEAFVPSAVNQDDLLMASRMTVKFGYGSARYGLELLLAAGREADWENSEIVQPEHFRLAQARMEAVMGHNEFRRLSRRSVELLKKLALLSASSDRAYFALKELEAIEDQDLSELRRIDFEGIVDLIEKGEESKIALIGIPVRSLQKLIEHA